MFAALYALLLITPSAHASCVRDLIEDTVVFVRGGSHRFANGDLPRAVRPRYDVTLTATDLELGARASAAWRDTLKEVIVWEALDARGQTLAKAFDEGRPFDIATLAFYVPAWPAFAAMLNELRASRRIDHVAQIRCVHVHVFRVDRYARWPFASFSKIDLQLSLQFKAVLDLAGLSDVDFVFGLLEPTHELHSTASQFVKTEFTLPRTMKWSRRDYPLTPGKKAMLRRAKRGLVSLHAVFEVP